MSGERGTGIARGAENHAKCRDIGRPPGACLARFSRLFCGRNGQSSGRTGPNRGIVCASVVNMFFMAVGWKDVGAKLAYR